MPAGGESIEKWGHQAIGLAVVVIAIIMVWGVGLYMSQTLNTATNNTLSNVIDILNTLTPQIQTVATFLMLAIVISIAIGLIGLLLQKLRGAVAGGGAGAI